MRENNKSRLVREHLISGKSITSWEAIQLYRATRLSAIIFNLRKDGLNIVGIPRHNDGTHWTEYRLE